ncbi:hypothetical protein ACUV84_032937 [Puccinellia chinampoensis]
MSPRRRVSALASMSGVGRRFVNLGVLDGFKRLYSLRRLDLAKVDLFYWTAEEAAAHAKVVPTLPLAQAVAPDRTRTCNTDLAAAEAAAPKIKSLPPPVLVTRPPASYLPGTRTINFFSTASENKVFVSNRANRVFHFDTDDACVLTMPSLHEHKYMPLAISVPPTTSHVYDYQDSGDLYIIDRLLKPNKGMAQFEALVWRSNRWHCDILPLPPSIVHHKEAFVCACAFVGSDTICFSISGPLGEGTYCFHTVTREWSKAGDWLMPFNGKAEYVPELGLWFGVAGCGSHLPCAVDLSGVVSGQEPPPYKTFIWADEDLPKEWHPRELFDTKVISLGSGRFFVANFFCTMQLDKTINMMSAAKKFAVFTGMEVAYDNDKGNGKDKDGTGSNGCSSRGNGTPDLRMIKHKSSRYMFNLRNMIEDVV